MLQGQTLQGYHDSVISNYTQKHSNINELKQKLDSLKANYQSLLSTTKSEHNYHLQYNLEKQIKDLEKEIDAITNKKDINEYYLNVIPYLNDYYNQDHNNLSEKAKIYNDYLVALNINNGSKNIYDCTNCGQQRVLNTILGIIVCENCGLTDYTVVEDTKQSYDDGIIPQDNNCFSYKKITHFRECIDQCQGKERTAISDEIFMEILKKIQEDNIVDKSKLTNQKIRQYLRELGYSGLYEHIPFILIKLNGQRPPEIPPEIETRLENMFKEVRVAFNKCRPQGRKNFPSYNYILHKCIQLIGTHDYLLPYFGLLKSDGRLKNIDEIWRAICEELNWEFISSW
jgi:hypothetical protein